MKYYSIYYIFVYSIYYSRISPQRTFSLTPCPHPSQLVLNSPYCLSYNSCDVISENLVLDQLIISKIDIFLYSHHLSSKHCIDIVRRNSLLATHGSKMIKHLLLNTPICPFKGTWWPFYVQCPGLWVMRSGFKAWMGHCVVFLGKIFYSHRASLNPGV